MITTAKFRVSRRLRCADTNRIMSPEMSPKSFGTFVNRPQDLCLNTGIPLQQLCHVFIIKSSINLELLQVTDMSLFIFTKLYNHCNRWFLQFEY